MKAERLRCFGTGCLPGCSATGISGCRSGFITPSKLCGFVTACYYNPDGRFAAFCRRLAPGQVQPGLSESCFADMTPRSLRLSSNPSRPSIYYSGSKPGLG